MIESVKTWLQDHIRGFRKQVSQSSSNVTRLLCVLLLLTVISSLVAIYVHSEYKTAMDRIHEQYMAMAMQQMYQDPPFTGGSPVSPLSPLYAR